MYLSNFEAVLNPLCYYYILPQTDVELDPFSGKMFEYALMPQAQLPRVSIAQILPTRLFSRLR